MSDFAKFLADNDTLEGPAARMERLRNEAGGRAEPQFAENCTKCRGTGTFRSYTGRSLGECFACKGKGRLVFKTSAEQRAKARVQVAERKERKEQESRAAFRDRHPAEWEWMNVKAPTFGFASSMVQAVAKWGDLSDKQMETVQRLMAQDAEREAKRAAERVEREARSAAVDITPITTAFRKAQLAGIRYPRLRLAAFQFKLSAKGPIYVTEGDDYLGKIEGSTFSPSRACTPDKQAEIIAVCADPKAAAIAYGQKFGSCSVCGRELTNKASIELGIGPICADKYGW